MYNIIMYLIAFLKVHTTDKCELRRPVNAINKNLTILADGKWWEIDVEFAQLGEIKDSDLTETEKTAIVMKVIVGYLSTCKVSNTQDATWLTNSLISNIDHIVSGGHNLQKEA